MIYFDNAASTPLKESVLHLLGQSMAMDFANPSSAHSLGKGLAIKIENARLNFLNLMQALDGFNFYFISSATEANNTIMKGLNLSSLQELSYFRGDHPSIVNTALNMGLKRNGTQTPENGQVLKFKLAIITHVNSQSGEVADVLQLAHNIKRENPDCWVHIDGVQAFGKIRLSLKGADIDSYCISAHKIHGPKGIAGLYIKKNKKIRPLIDGGGQEEGLRSSTLSAPLIFAFELAATEAMATLDQNYVNIKELNEYLKKLLKGLIPEIIFPFLNSGPYILTLIIPKLASDIMVRHLERDQIYISSSSACSSKIKGIHPSFKALGISNIYHKNVLRVSFGHQNKKEEVDQFFKTFKRHFLSLRPLMN